MAGNAQKVHFQRSQNQFGEKKAREAIQKLGKALPASVVSVSASIVKVKFEIQSGFTLPQVEMPMFGPEYIRYPIQPGCKGVVFPADAHLGAMTGLGTGTSTLVQPANLAALVFFPIANKDWAAPDDPDMLELYGEPGVITKTKDGAIYIKITAAGIEMKGNVHMLNDLTVDGALTSTGESDLAGGAKKVVLDGDPVVGGGGGTVQSSATKTKAT